MSTGSSDPGGSPNSCSMTRNEAAVITAVDDSVTEILGWRAEQMVGSPSTAFIHPEDQGSAVAAWFEMLAQPGATVSWRGRYRTASGGWQWVETKNTNRLDDAGDASVTTTITRIEVDQLSVEEELRSRKQVLDRLADAVPVGLFQIDRARRIAFTNDRLHEMLGIERATTCEEQFQVVVDEDRHLLEAGVTAVLEDQPVDGLELRFKPPVPDRKTTQTKVCLLSLRPLTEENGTVSGAIGSVSDVTEGVQLRRELEIRASVDGLTGCLNRQATMELLEILMSRSERGRSLGVIFIDIDRFKNVNDELGHAAGDTVLVEVADRIRNVIRDKDQLGRIGGDEFLVICPEMLDLESAVQVAERVSGVLREGIALEGGRADLQASVGVAWTDEPTSPDSLVADADRAMYRSKRDGRGAVISQSPGGSRTTTAL